MKISDGMPRSAPTVFMISTSGIITAWYGMNMPNRISVKTRSAPRKRHRDNTNPFIEPRNAEINDAGMTRPNVRQNESDSVLHARSQPAVSQFSGNDHAVSGEMSAPVLKLVTNSTYAGIRTMIKKNSSSTYLTVRTAVDRGPRVPGSCGGLAFLAFLVFLSAVGLTSSSTVVVIGDAPRGRC